jgi:hypothetical protein
VRNPLPLILCLLLWPVRLFRRRAQPSMCEQHGHDWKRTRSTTRVCQRCGREEAVWANRFPGIGEAATYWAASPTQRLKDCGLYPDKGAERD